MPPLPGDFGIKPGGGLAMWLVRLGTFSHYGHACVVTASNPLQGVRIVEARPDGVRETWVKPTEFRWSTGGSINLLPHVRQKIVATARMTVGRGYDWPSIAGFVVRFMGAKFGYSPEHPDNKLMCSELVVWAYREAGINLFPNKAPGDVSPGDLEQFCPPVEFKD